MNLYSMIFIGLVFFLSAYFSFFIRKSKTSILLSISIPVVLLAVYLLVVHDEFGQWALVLTFGLCYCLIGSTAGVFAGRFLRKKLKPHA